MDRGFRQATVHGVAKESDTTERLHVHALEKEMATHSSVLARRIPGTGSLVGCRLRGRTESRVYWTSLVAQLVKNLPAAQETQVLSLGGDHPLEKGRATHSSILA